ncbi:MAG: cell division topological specificity factor MinE [Thiotrichaceae bacterium]|nr:cell division topological specificity factor MinE [Thiotrichaceae bacterium]
MNLLSYFQNQNSQTHNTAAVAKERLQIIVAHARRQRDPSTLDCILPHLQQELLEVVRKYIMVDDDDIKINLERDGDYEILELNITLPEQELAKNEK